MAFMLSLLLIASGDSLAGRDAFARLDYGIGAREVAIGGAAAACCNSPAAAFWNPAALSVLRTGGVTSFYRFTPLGSAFTNDRDISASLAWGQPVGHFAFGFVLDHLRLGGIEARQWETKGPDGLLEYSETMAALSASFWVLPGLSVGGGGVLYMQGYSAIANNPAYPGLTSRGFSGSFGLYYEPINLLEVGLTARMPAVLSWGPDYVSDIVGQRTALGIAVLPMKGLTIATELDSRRNRAYDLSAGVEYRAVFSEPKPWDPRPLFAATLRAGVKDVTGFGSDVTATPAATLGGGVEVGKSGFQLSVDYVVVYSSVSHDSHSLGLTVGY